MSNGTDPRRPLAGGPPPPGNGQAVSASELQKRRDALARELAELQWDLGGLAYEMAIRDHFRLDVLMRQAGRLQEVDAKLGEVEHLLRLDTTGAAGACPQCGTLYARGALFCSRCAFQLVGVQQVGGALSPPPPPAPAAPAAPAAPDAPYGLHAPDERDATVAFERPAAEPPAR